VTGFAIAGTPADCVKIGFLLMAANPPDVVVSGINRGANTGANVWYSGTVAGAREGALLGVPAVAVSAELMSPEPHYELAATITARVCTWIAGRAEGTCPFYNINVPAGPIDEIAGVRLTTHGRTRLVDQFDRRTDPKANPYYWMTWENIDHDPDPATDGRILDRKYISITPLSIDQTDRGELVRMHEGGFEDFVLEEPWP